MSKHTPGPWSARSEDSEGGYSIEPRDEPNSRVVICARPPWSGRADESRANARLIAAAPELLEALVWLTNTTCDVGKSGEPPTMNEHIEAIEAAKAAITKAEGR